MKHKVMRGLTLILLLPILLLLGAIKVKDIGKSTAKWSENGARAAEEFATNAEAAADEWARNTANAAGTYAQAISAPGIKTRFAKGVARAGAAKFARKIREVGRDRFGPGIAAASTDYQAGAEPYFATIAALTLPARKPRGDPANYGRVEAIGKALNAKRIALLGGTTATSTA